LISITFIINSQKEYLQAAITGTKKLYDKTILNIAPDGGWILILHGEALFIYGENWNTDQFDEIRKIIDLNQFNNYTIIGNTELIDSLLKFYKVTNICVTKDRIFYRTSMIAKFENQSLKIAIGNISELNELSSMLQQYYHEEYKGENDKSIEEMQRRTLQVINARKIVVLKNTNDQILGFCTIIDPDIGILFTKTEHRKLGYGKILLSYCSSQLFKKNGKFF
jgi:hypothetical protein